MTTIAYRDGIMAGDTRVTAGEVILPDVSRKVRRLRNGMLVGAAGKAGSIQALMKVLKKDHTARPVVKDVHFLVVGPDGKIEELDDSGWTDVNAPYCAIGAGAAFAFGALAYGATAKEAVQIAAKFDVCTGGKIQTVRLDD